MISQSPVVSQQAPTHMQPSLIQTQPHLQTSPYMEPPQYVAAIPVQPLMANFAPPTLLSPLPVSII